MSGESGKIEYFAVSTRKLVIMSTLSLGFYQVYWHYRNWHAVKEQGGGRVRPVWRGIFGLLFTYPLFKRILNSAQQNGFVCRYSAVFLTAVYIFLTVSYRFHERWGWMIGLLNFLPLIYIQNAIEANNAAQNHLYQPEEEFHKLEIVVCVIGGIVLVLALIGTFNPPKNGSEKIFDKDGKLQSINSYKDDVLEGHVVMYDQDGRMKQVIHYHRGVKDGDEWTYNEAGKVIEHKVFKDGLLISTVKMDDSGMVVREDPLEKSKAFAPSEQDPIKLKLEDSVYGINTY